MSYDDDDPSLLPQLPPPTTRSTSATSVDGPPTSRLCRRLALITDVSAGTAMDVCASPVDGRRIIHAFLSAGPVVEVRLLRDTLGPLAAASDATYGRYFMLGYNGNFHLWQMRIVAFSLSQGLTFNRIEFKLSLILCS